MWNREIRKKEEFTVDEHEQRLVWVKDKAGNEYVCRVMDLKDPSRVSDDDLRNCVDDASRAINVGD
ncbi:MAG: hypothetical protein CVU57_15300 [Deltaproteobacteria bacterium HGW-Deltaproteobacteria-15]|nr:MAG: hypothetical protein CVU57_15300 [Deltaproteobacteria bacterium HGW-Deltaproteobacteria-15]